MSTELAGEVAGIAKELGFRPLDIKTLPPSEPIYCEVPTDLNQNLIHLLRALYPIGLYQHQAKAIASFMEGNDICLSTATASGKSLVFHVATLQLLLSSKESRCLAIYPSKALIQDQLLKWKAILSPLKFNVGFVDGGVPVRQRIEILSRNEVILMTPDVMHAWMMANCSTLEVATFLRSIGLLILDEAHVYEGVFGTNMAYLLRRFQEASSNHQIICSTATLGEPNNFVELLTGRNPVSFGPENDTSAKPSKEIILVSQPEKNFEAMVQLLKSIGEKETLRFLAFADSRRMVEQLVSTMQRKEKHSAESEEEECNDQNESSDNNYRVLPYRAGYEAEDRIEIQNALINGTLRGLVTTSALEIGLDVGDINLILLLSPPPNIKSFWQRIGRAGRKRPAVCLMVDSYGLLARKGLNEYLSRPLEPNWLYLENKYIQYVNALCAAQEFANKHSNSTLTVFESLPRSFKRFLENELNPSEMIQPDLYPLKQRALAGPHREFPIRNVMEQEFQIKDVYHNILGRITYPQALHEAYPGAVYYHMAKAFRVKTLNYRYGEIHVWPEKRYTTRPIIQTMVFPRFPGGVLKLFEGLGTFLAETEMQVSERVLGFIEQRGQKKSEHRYDTNSPFARRELNRFFLTTGVCWYLEDDSLSEELVQRIVESFCIEFGVQQKDLGIGQFFSKISLIGPGTCRGTCIFDATMGSLRLTEMLAKNFKQVLKVATNLCAKRGETRLLDEIETLEMTIDTLAEKTVSAQLQTINSFQDQEWIEVIRPNHSAMYSSVDGPIEVIVKAHRYTPKGLWYDLVSTDETSHWTVDSVAVQPINGITRTELLNLFTGEIKPIEKKS